MLKTRKLISLLLVVAMVLSVFAVGIVATSAAGGDYYLTGTVAGWGIDENFVMTKTENEDHVEYAIYGVTLGTSDMIKAVKATKSGDSIAQWYPDGMDNNTTVDKAGVYDIYFRPNGDGEEDWAYIPYSGDGSGLEAHGATVGGRLFYLDLKEETEEPDPSEDPSEDPVDGETITVYFTDNASWGEANIYYWPDGGKGWPGTAMDVHEAENFEGKTVYSAQIPADAQGIVFNGGGSQTVDITDGITDGAGWYTTEQNGEGKYEVGTFEPLPDDPSEDPSEEPIGGDTITVHFTDNASWGEANIYYWPDGGKVWPGSPMDFEEENFEGKTVYSAQIPADAQGIVFNGGGSQTVDITDGIADGAGWYTTDQNEEGKWNVEPWGDLPVDPSDDPSEDPSDEPTPAGSNYYLTGTVAGWGIDANYNMTKTENADHEEYVIRDVALTTEDMIKAVKATKSGDSIAQWYPDGMDNNTTVEEDGVYDIYFRPNGDGESDWVYIPYAGDGTGLETHGATVGGYLFYLEKKASDEPTQPSEDEGSSVTINGVKYDVEVGDKFNITYYFNVSPIYLEGDIAKGKINNIDGRILFDNTKIKVTSDLSAIEDDETDVAPRDLVFPRIKSGLTMNVVSEGIRYNASREAGYTFNKDTDYIFSMDFEVVAEGHSEITTPIRDMLVRDDKDDPDRAIYFDFEYKRGDVAPESAINNIVVKGLEDKPVPTEPATDAPVPTEPATDAPVPTEPATDAPVPTQPVDNQSTVTIYDLAGNSETHYVHVGDKLTMTTYLNVSDIADRLTSIDANVTYDADMLKLNVPTKYDEEDEQYVTDYDTVFPQIAKKANPTANFSKPGVVKFNASVETNGFLFNNDQRVLVQLQFDVVAEGHSDIKTNLVTLAIETEDGIKTILDEGKLIVDGTLKMWETLDGASGKDEPAPTEPATDAPVPTEPATDAPVPTEPATDAPVPTEPATDAPVPTEPATDAPVPTQPAEKVVTIIADGVSSVHHQGDVLDYVFFMNAGGKVCSVEGQTAYDKTGLALGEIDELTAFPKLPGVIFKSLDSSVKFTFSNEAGVNFKYNNSILVRLPFTVTAEEGTYEINTILDIVAGEDETILVDRLADPAVDTLPYKAGAINPEITPEPIETEPATDAPVPTEPATDAPVPTEPATDAPVPTEPATDAPVVPTQPATDAPTPVIGDYSFTETTDSWTKGATSGTGHFVVKSSVADEDTFGKFQSVQIDGNNVFKAAYTAKAGSLILDIKASYMNTLNVGEHTLTLNFTDGTVETKFNVVEEGAEPTEPATDAPVVPDETTPLTPVETTASEEPSDETTADETTVETQTSTSAVTPTAQTPTSKSSTTTTTTPVNTSTVKTGSTELAIIFLMILVAACGIVMYTTKRKRD